MTARTQDAQSLQLARFQQAPAAEPDIAPVPDRCGHFVVGAVGVTEEGGACEAPGVAYGGRFAPEALMAALDELATAYEQARKDPLFRAELDGLLRGYAGRPTLLTEARRFGEQAGGCTVCSSARISPTPGRTRSTTCSARCCWPGEWTRRG